MAQISGVNITATSLIAGISVTSISAIAGISTSDIPGWPTGASCTTVFYGYTDGRKYPPEDACTSSPFPYDWDATSQTLYLGGGCGNTELIAPRGFYSDGRTIYFWDGRAWTEYGPCSKIESYSLISSNPTVSSRNATNGYPLSQLMMATAVDSRANTDNMFYVYYVDKSTDGGNSWVRDFTYTSQFNINPKTGNPEGPIVSNLFVGQVQGRDPGGIPPSSIFRRELYKATGYPIFDDYTSYVEIIMDAGSDGTAPFIVSYQSYYQGTPYY